MAAVHGACCKLLPHVTRQSCACLLSGSVDLMWLSLDLSFPTVLASCAVACRLCSWQQAHTNALTHQCHCECCSLQV